MYRKSYYLYYLSPHIFFVDESQETPEDESDDVGVLVRNEIEDAKEQDQDGKKDK